jgi:SAM-dependent methyltransferase
MKEQDIRDLDVFRRYLELSRQDADRIFSDRSKFQTIACPACDCSEHVAYLEKNGFTYVRCRECQTFYVNPRPTFADLQKFYSDSESTSYWVNYFFKPKAESRRVLMFRPRAETIVNRFPELARGKIGEIGAGFGIFLEELRKLWPHCSSVAIEPSREMAQICADKQLEVLEAMFEQLDTAQTNFDLLATFELVEHLQDPFAFLCQTRKSLRPGGSLFFTTLSGLGLDIQILGSHSKSVSPPHHLNFFNPHSIAILLRRCAFKNVEVSTPGRLDWSIIENSIKEGIDPGPFWLHFAHYADQRAKEELQSWLSKNLWSSHMQVIAS